MAQIHRFCDAAQSVERETFGQSQGLTVSVDIGDQSAVHANPKYREQLRKAKNETA